MATNYPIPALPLDYDLETKEVLRQLNKASRSLAELNGVAQKIPNENILLGSLVLQEALDSSAVENIVTTSDELYQADLDIKGHVINAATKEVLNYRQAMQLGFRGCLKTDVNAGVADFGVDFILREQERTGCTRL